MRPYTLLAAWLVALAATLITLYMTEFLLIPVCPLCWYQKVFLYPLAIQLGIACYREDAKFTVYAMPLAVISGCIALYQYLLQMVPSLAPLKVCRADATGVDCAAIHWQLFGFITLPFLSLLACLLIILLLLLSRRH